MRDLMKSIAIATGKLATFALWIAGTGLVAMTVLIAAQVFWRYVLNNSISWTEPASVMIMGWFIFLGAAVGIREGFHLSFDVLVFVVPDRVKKTFFTISDLAVTCFGAGMIWYGWELAAKTAGNKLPSLGISGAFDFMPVVGGGVLIVLFSLERIFRRLAGLHTRRFGDPEIVEA